MSSLERDPTHTTARPTTRVVLVGGRRLYLEALAAYLDAQPGISATCDLSSRDDLSAAGESSEEQAADVVLIDAPSRAGGEEAVGAAGSRYPAARRVLLVDGRDQRDDKRSNATIGALSTQMRPSDLARALLQPSWRPSPRRSASGRARHEPLDSLSERETRVLQMMVAGSSAPEVAAALGISPHTVRTHVQNVMAKLGCRSRVEMIAIGRRVTAPAAAWTWS